jgi:SAM-dependent methyltransferase
MNLAPKIRDYRFQLINYGQASPSNLGKFIANLIKKKIKNKTLSKHIKIVDVGCGLGNNMKLINEMLPNTFISIHGVDWSPATYQFHKNNPNSIYNEIQLCDSSKLPYLDNEFDIALSMENLEHLYSDGCVRSLEEMSRISSHLLITTPLPADVINFRFIYPELVEAALDQIPLTNHDYVCLESAIHKSTLFPKSMSDAGFSIESKTHGIYFGLSKDIDIRKLSYVSIEPSNDTTYSTNQQKYLQLLANSAALYQKIISHKLYQTPPITFQILLGYLELQFKKLNARLR